MTIQSLAHGVFTQMIHGANPLVIDGTLHKWPTSKETTYAV